MSTNDPSRLPTLDQIHIENFKSYHKATLKLSSLTFLIGANASGKSNAIEAIRFLSWLAKGQRLDDMWRTVRETDIQIRGTTRQDLLYDGAKGNHIRLGCSLSDIGEWKHFSAALQLDNTDLRIIEEEIRSDGTTVPLYEIKEQSAEYSHEVQVAYNNFARGGLKPTIPCTDRQAIFTQLDVPSRFKNAKSRQIIPPIVSKLQESFQRILFLDPIPRHMTAYSSMVDKTLKGDGENISTVLYDLCEVQEQKKAILSFIRALPEQDIVDIQFIETPRNEVMVQLVESFGDKHVERDAPLLSDGTLRVLAVAAALLSAPEGSLIIIEEIDNGIHPNRAGMMLENILAVSQKKQLRVLLTSHNPALLDALPNSAIPDIVACYRDSKTGSSQLVRLEDLGEYPELVAQGSMGQLLTDGIIDRYLKSQSSPDARRKKSLEWFKAFREELVST